MNRENGKLLPGGFRAQNYGDGCGSNRSYIFCFYRIMLKIKPFGLFLCLRDGKHRADKIWQGLLHKPGRGQRFYHY
jgi:hypothetical protein